MTEPLKCEICGKPASVHLTQIVNNKMIKAEYCEECAKKKGLLNPNLLSLPDLFAKKGHIALPLLPSSPQLSQPLDVNALKCPSCGMNANDFKQTARLGCAECYTALKPIVSTLLSGIYKNPKHTGKVPQSKPVDLSIIQAQISDLEKMLKKAIKDEYYEKAAELRDQITALKANLTPASTKKK